MVMCNVYIYNQMVVLPLVDRIIVYPCDDIYLSDCVCLSDTVHLSDDVYLDLSE
jgi:hypothetical protein